MSELLVVDDDPDPLPADETRNYPVNFETDLAYVGPEAAATLLAEEARVKYEKEAVGQLTVAADRILREYDVAGEFEDCRVQRGDTMLRRRIVTHREEDRIVSGTSYFYVDKSAGQNYCRSWSSTSEQVNWCYQEQRHEPADAVRARLETTFPPLSSQTPSRHFGGRVLAKLLRRD